MGNAELPAAVPAAQDRGGLQSPLLAADSGDRHGREYDNLSLHPRRRPRRGWRPRLVMVAGNCSRKNGLPPDPFRTAKPRFVHSRCPEGRRRVWDDYAGVRGRRSWSDRRRPNRVWLASWRWSSGSPRGGVVDGQHRRARFRRRRAPSAARSPRQCGTRPNGTSSTAREKRMQTEQALRSGTVKERKHRPGTSFSFPPEIGE